MAVRTIETEISLTNEGKFNEQMKGINSNLKNLKSDMAAVTAEFKGNEKSIEALTAKEKIQNEAAEQSAKKVEALTKLYEAAVEQYGEASEQVDKYRRNLNYAKVEQSKYNEALEKTRKELTEAEKAEKKYENANEKLKKKTSELSGKLKEKVTALKEAAKNTPGLSEALDVLSVSATGAGKALEASGKVMSGALKAGAVAATATTAALVTGVKTMTSWAKSAADSAKAAKESGEELNSNQKSWLILSTRLEKFDETAERAKSAIAATLLPSLSDLSVKGTLLLKSFSKEMEGAAGDPEKMGQIISRYITIAAKMIKAMLPEIMDLAKSFLGGIGDGLVKNSDQLIGIAGDIVNMLLDGIMDMAPELGTGATKLIMELGEKLLDSSPELIEAGLELILALLEGFVEGLPDILKKLPDIISDIVKVIIKLAPRFLEAGKELIAALWQGLKDALGRVTKWLGKKFSSIKSGININNNSSDLGVDGYATGLNTVPYDNFPAYLHKGEAVLSASQAAQWRAGESSVGSEDGTIVTVPVSFELDNSIDGMTLAKQMYSYNLTVERNHGVKLVRTGGNS